MDQFLHKRKKKFLFLSGILLALQLLCLLLWGLKFSLIVLASICFIEIFLQIVIRKLAIPNGVVATLKLPVITRGLVEKFVAHGFDPELGWIRKANTSKVDFGIPYNIDALGSRNNPCPPEYPATIATFGDSYCFCREVSDDETWQAFLTKRTQQKVLNFGVGNYGFDQSLIRMKREYPHLRTPVVIMAVVPHTLARILSVWKHYNEHGNVLAFKPSYYLDKGQLHFRENFVSSPEQYFQIQSFIRNVNQCDYFYGEKFIKNAFSFPYTISALNAPDGLLLLLLKSLRNIFSRFPNTVHTIDKIIIDSYRSEGPKQLAALYKQVETCDLLATLVDEFVRYSRLNSFTPIFLMMPMKDDLLYVQKYGSYYEDFCGQLASRLTIIDLTPRMLKEANIYSLFNKWHYGPKGNQLVVSELMNRIDFTKFRNMNGISR